MNPDFQEQQSDITMPMPRQEHGSTPDQELQPQDSVHEVAVATRVEQAQSSPDPSVVAAASATVTTPLPPDPTASVLPAGITSATSVLPMMADDTDLIEKEWVEKAKQIVEQTSQDPYLQTKELNKLKSDYLKKRYNKDLGLGDE